MTKDNERDIAIKELMARLRKDFPEEKSGLRHQAYELKLRQMAEAEIRRRTVADAEERRKATREKNGTTPQRYDSDGLTPFADRAYIPRSDAEHLIRTKRERNFKGDHGLNTSDRRPGHDSRKRPKRKT